MATLIILFGAMVVWHFVAQALIWPALLHVLRFEFFQLRDRTRELMLEHPDVDDRALVLLNEAINKMIHDMPDFGLSFLFSSRRDQQAEALVEACTIPGYQELRQECAKRIQWTVAANSVGWAPYLLLPVAPALLVWMAWDRFFRISEEKIAELGTDGECSDIQFA